GIVAPFVEMSHAHAVGSHLVLREIDPALGEVELDVLPEVDELQRRAHRIGPGEVMLRRSFEKMQEQPTDRVGRAPAVVEELGEISVALLRYILRKGVKQSRK